jgi:hypothetical protein
MPHTSFFLRGDASHIDVRESAVVEVREKKRMLGEPCYRLHSSQLLCKKSKGKEEREIRGEGYQKRKINQR